MKTQKSTLIGSALILFSLLTLLIAGMLSIINLPLHFTNNNQITNKNYNLIVLIDDYELCGNTNTSELLAPVYIFVNITIPIQVCNLQLHNNYSLFLTYNNYSINVLSFNVLNISNITNKKFGLNPINTYNFGKSIAQNDLVFYTLYENSNTLQIKVIDSAVSVIVDLQI